MWNMILLMPGAGEKAQLLSTLAALPVNQEWFPARTQDNSPPSITPVPKDLQFQSPLLAAMVPTHVAYLYPDTHANKE